MKNYRQNHKELDDILAEEQLNFDSAMANAAEDGLFSNLKDRYVTEKTSEVFFDENDERIKSHIVEKKKFVPANPTLVIFALKNKIPERYNKLDSELIKVKTESVKQNMSNNQDSLDVGKEILDRIGQYRVNIDVFDLDIKSDLNGKDD